MKVIVHKFTNKKHPRVVSSEDIIKVRGSLSMNNDDESSDSPFLKIKITKRDEIEVSVKSDNYRKFERNDWKRKKSRRDLSGIYTR